MIILMSLKDSGMNVDETCIEKIYIKRCNFSTVNRTPTPDI